MQLCRSFKTSSSSSGAFRSKKAKTVMETFDLCLTMVLNYFCHSFHPHLEEVHANQQEELLERCVLCRQTFLGFLLQVCHRLHHTGNGQMVIERAQWSVSTLLLYRARVVSPPVPGLSLLSAEGLAALHVLRLAEEHLSELHQVVDPHGAVCCHSVRSPLSGAGGSRGSTLSHVFSHWQVMHGHEESEWRAERQ